jgi:hypothetical protein
MTTSAFAGTAGSATVRAAAMTNDFMKTSLSAAWPGRLKESLVPDAPLRVVKTQ